jgi:hypothetical protein
MLRVVDERNRLKRQWGAGTPWDTLHGSVRDADFLWVNQGGASYAQRSSGGIYLTAPAGAGDNWRLRAVPSKAPPYVMVCAYWPMLVPMTTAGEAPAAAVGWRDSSTEKLALFRIYYDGTDGALHADYSHWNSPTSFNSTQAGPVFTDWLEYGSAVWVKLQDDNTNRLIHLSPDGIEWPTVWFSELRTNFLTPNRLVFGCNADNANYPAAMKLLTWYRES